MNLAQYIMALGRSLDVTNVTGAEAETSASSVVGNERNRDLERVRSGGVGEQLSSNCGENLKDDVRYVCYFQIHE
jgi:hypothetical protein